MTKKIVIYLVLQTDQSVLFILKLIPKREKSMKRKSMFIILSAVLFLALPFSGNSQTNVSGNGNSSAPHIGTWKLASYKYSASGNFVPVAKGDQHIKLITATHFMWAESDSTTKKVSEMAGGTYTLNGNTYTESIDFGLGMENYLGHKQTFTLMVEGDQLFLTGMLSDGYHVGEVWQRVK
jgi:hypothetical protein